MSSDPRDPGLESDPGGAYVALVVRLAPAADGTWQMRIDGTLAPMVVRLAPLTLAVRLWRSPTGGFLRGSLQVHGDERWVPFQSDAQLEDVVRDWLLSHPVM